MSSTRPHAYNEQLDVRTAAELMPSDDDDSDFAPDYAADSEDEELVAHAASGKQATKKRKKTAPEDLSRRTFRGMGAGGRAGVRKPKKARSVGADIISDDEVEEQANPIFPEPTCDNQPDTLNQDPHESSSSSFKKDDQVEDLWAEMNDSAKPSTSLPSSLGSSSNSKKKTKKKTKKLNWWEQDKPKKKKKKSDVKLVDFDSQFVEIQEKKEFAGKEVVLKQKVLKDSLVAQKYKQKKMKQNQLDDVLFNLQKKPQLSTVEKSKLDWDVSKKEENDGEQLKEWSKGADSYTAQQTFLKKVDWQEHQATLHRKKFGKYLKDD